MIIRHPTEAPDPASLKEAFFVGLISAAVYLSLLSINYDSNGIVIAKAVEAGDWSSLNHLLYELIGILGLGIGRLLQWNGRAIHLLQGIVAISGGLTLGFAYLAARRTGSDRIQSFLAVAWLGTTFAFWKWSTDVAYIATAAIFAAAAVAITWHKVSPWHQVGIGIMAALSVLAWQANIILLPILLAGNWANSASRKSWIKLSAFLCLTFVLTLTVAYIFFFYHVGAQDINGMVKRLISHGAGGNLPSWGHWGLERISIAAHTWINSVIGWVSLTPHIQAHPIRFNTIFPRLAPYALAMFLAVTLWAAIKGWKDRVALYLLFSFVAYLPFVIWWDPWETKWLLIPNVFFALFCARIWSLRRMSAMPRIRFLIPIAASVICISNLSMYGVPAHSKLSQDYRIGYCVGKNLGPSDIYIATDWAFGDYMSYTHQRTSIDLISIAVSRQFNKNETFKDIRKMIGSLPEGGRAFIPDPAILHPNYFKFLKSLTAIDAEELDSQLPGRPAFRCGDRAFREVERSAYP
jgi:hypothetical protein